MLETSVFIRLHNVDVIRTQEGAARAPHETCLRQGSDTRIG
jgi:hypothetical protein